MAEGHDVYTVTFSGEACTRRSGTHSDSHMNLIVSRSLRSFEGDVLRALTAVEGSRILGQ